MQTRTPINTASIERLLQQIKNADQSHQKQVTIDIASAKEVSYA